MFGPESPKFGPNLAELDPILADFGVEGISVNKPATNGDDWGDAPLLRRWRPRCLHAPTRSSGAGLDSPNSGLGFYCVLYWIFFLRQLFVVPNRIWSNFVFVESNWVFVVSNWGFVSAKSVFPCRRFRSELLFFPKPRMTSHILSCWGKRWQVSKQFGVLHVSGSVVLKGLAMLDPLAGGHPETSIYRHGGHGAKRPCCNSFRTMTMRKKRSRAPTRMAAAAQACRGIRTPLNQHAAVASAADISVPQMATPWRGPAGPRVARYGEPGVRPRSPSGGARAKR